MIVGVSLFAVSELNFGIVDHFNLILKHSITYLLYTISLYEMISHTLSSDLTLKWYQVNVDLQN